MLADYRTAPIGDRLRATLGLLEKMTLDHQHLEPEDIRAVMQAGVSKAAIADALVFNIYDRLADAMGWDVPPSGGGYYQIAARRLLKRGYA